MGISAWAQGWVRQQNHAATEFRENATNRHIAEGLKGSTSAPGAPGRAKLRSLAALHFAALDVAALDVAALDFAALDFAALDFAALDFAAA